MTQLEGELIQGGVDFIVPDINITNNGSTAATPGTLGNPVSYGGPDGQAGEVTPVPNAYYARPLGDGGLWLGVSLTAPFGLALDYGENWFGRYDSINNELTTINLAPALAYRINDSWSIGGGINFEYADATLSNALPNPLNPGGPTAASDGLAEATGDSWDVGYNVGIMYHRGRTRLGLHYRSAIEHGLGGNTSISRLTGPLAGANGVSATNIDLEVPAIAALAVSHDLTDRLRLLAEVQWFGWSSFDEIRIRFDNGAPDQVRPQNYSDTWSAGLSAEYQWTEKWQWRAGFLVDESPTNDEFRGTSIPDSDQVWYGLGATYRPSERWRIGLGYTYSDFDSADINLFIPAFAGTPVAGLVNVKGRTRNHVNVYSVDVRYHFR
jgi:long-chain fatty acid transport protein